MRFKIETLQDEEARRGEWRRWFAWYPVEADRHCVWLALVWRRFERTQGWGGDGWVKHYREITAPRRDGERGERWTGHKKRQS